MTSRYCSIIYSPSCYIGSMAGLLSRLFKNAPRQASVCLVGEVNTGKSTLANRIANDFAGEELSEVSEIPHETRDIKKLEHVDFIVDGSRLDLTLVDTPGIATSVNFKEFMEHGISQEDAIKRAKEATSGIVSSIKFLKEVDVALVLMDSTKPPFDQVSLTIMGALELQKTKTIIVANKTDLEDANAGLIQSTFPHMKVIPISALNGDGIDRLYQEIAEAA